MKKLLSHWPEALVVLMAIALALTLMAKANAL